MRDKRLEENTIRSIKKLFGKESKVLYLEYLPGKVYFKLQQGISVVRYIAKVKTSQYLAQNKEDLENEGEVWDVKELED